MNRRTFAAAGAASLASLSTFVAVRAQSGLTLESKSTGAVIDYSDTGYEFVDHTVTTTSNGGTSERMEVASDLGTLIIHFTNWVPRVQAEDLHGLSLEFLHEAFGPENVEDLGMHALDDGAWMAYRTESTRRGNMLWYNEFQLGAFPDVDLFVELSMSEASLEAALEEAQRVKLAGMPPFLFLEESAVTDGLFEQTGTSTGTGFDRLVVSGRDSDNQNASRSQSAGSEDDVINAVRNHQQQFRDELQRFSDALDVMTNGEVFGEEEMELITGLMDIMFSWSVYPEEANKLSFPADLSNLEAVYREWADGIGHMGMTMGQWMLGEGEIDAFIEAMEIALELDVQLTVELNALGSVPPDSELTAHAAVKLRLGNLARHPGNVFS